MKQTWSEPSIRRADEEKKNLRASRSCPSNSLIMNSIDGVHKELQKGLNYSSSRFIKGLKAG